MKLAAALQERFAAWALRARPPEPTPVVLGERRIYVLPTRPGFMFALTLLAMWLGAVNYNLGLGHALVFLLASLGLVAILHTFRNLVGIRIETGRAEPVFAGETARFALLLHNPREEERRLIHIGVRGGSSDSIDIPGGATAIAQVGLRAARRGWLQLPRVTLATTFPLGLVRAWSYAAPAMRCLVYPHPAGNAPPLPISGGAGDGLRAQAAGSEDFAGLRTRQPADPLRHVAWKVAARRAESAPLLTKQFAGGIPETLWLDWDMIPPDWPDAEAKLSLLARWVLDAAAAGHSWGLRLPGKALPPASGDAHVQACLKALALHEPAAR